MATPTDLVNDYMTSRISVPQTPYTQQQSDERYSAENEDGNNDEYLSKLSKKREYEEEPVPTREEYEANQREAEREIEYNSRQRELDDLDESASDYEEDAEFSGNYFAQPDENEEKSSRLGDRIREKYDSFRASASDTAESLSSTFGASFGAAAGAASAKYSRFKRGDPIFSMQQPAKRGKNPYTRSISRPGRSISRPYSGGRFGDSFSLGTNAGYNPYYPINAGRQSASPRPTMDMYLPSGASPYEGEFSSFNDRKSFKNSEFNTPPYDPFGFGGLSGDGFKNTEKFGDTLMGFNSDLLGGGAGNDTVFGSIGKNQQNGMDLFSFGSIINPKKQPKAKPQQSSTRKTKSKKTSVKSKTKSSKRQAKEPKSQFNYF